MVRPLAALPLPWLTGSPVALCLPLKVEARDDELAALQEAVAVEEARAAKLLDLLDAARSQNHSAGAHGPPLAAGGGGGASRGAAVQLRGRGSAPGGGASGGRALETARSEAVTEATEAPSPPRMRQRGMHEQGMRQGRHRAAPASGGGGESNAPSVTASFASGSRASSRTSRLLRRPEAKLEPGGERAAEERAPAEPKTRQTPVGASRQSKVGGKAEYKAGWRAF